MTRLVGESRAQELILTGRALNAKRAARIGLVDLLVPTAYLERESAALVERVNALAPDLIAVTGDLVDGNRGVVEYNDLLKKPIDAYKYLIATCEKGTSQRTGSRVLRSRRSARWTRRSPGGRRRKASMARRACVQRS